LVSLARLALDPRQSALGMMKSLARLSQI